MENKDDQACFKWAILSALFPASIDTQRVSKYIKHESSLNLTDISMPTPLSKTTFLQFLKQNPTIHLNVFLFDEDDGVIPFFSDPEDPQKAIDLLFLPHEDTSSGHYVWIKNFSKLLHDVTKERNKKYFCKRCFYWNTSEPRLFQHLQDCNLLTSEDGIKKIINHCTDCPVFTPDCDGCKEENILRFKNNKAIQYVPAYLVADFEACLKPVMFDDENNQQKQQQHLPISFGIKIVISSPYRDLDCFKDFINQKVIVHTNETDLSKKFLSIVNSLGNSLFYIIRDEYVEIKWNQEIREEYLKCWTCHICKKRIINALHKVADHDHLTGKFRGAAHNGCNLNLNYEKLKIPVILHNYKGYDSKLILQDIGKMNQDSVSNLFVLAQNSEQFKTMSFGHVQFIDSFLHLPSSLSQLVKNLAAEVKHDINQAKRVFFHLASEFDYLSDEAFSLLLQKGVFPYSWLDEPKKLQQTELPRPEAFFNDLNREAITPAEYAHAQKVWSTITTIDGRNMQTFQDYLELYLKTDVLLLADVIANYQDVSQTAYGLDPLWFLTAPSLSFNAALKMTHVRLELLTDVDMIHFFQKGIRGGMSYVCKRKSIVNLPGMETYKEDKHKRTIFYTDANNLYGSAMMAPMPRGGFKWLKKWQPPTLRGSSFKEQMEEIEEEWSTNYVLEVDAIFPESKHDKMSDYPFLPESIVPPGGKFPKLINHLGRRERYVLSFEMYLLAKMEGVQFPQIHRVLEYEQSKWLAPYINMNTEMRRKATTQFEQDYYKLMNNSVYGKWMEDVTKYIDFELFTNQNSKKYKKLHHRQPYKIKRSVVYHRCLQHEQNPKYAESCSENDSCVVGMEKKKMKVKLNKPIYVGFKVLEVSKLIMYQMYYHVFQEQFGSRMKLCLHDTDSFIFEIESENLDQELYSIREHMDLSNYPLDHPLFDPSNKKVPGKMKNEYPDQQIKKFIGLRSKCYCLEVEEDEEKRAKGVKKSVIKKELSLQDYENCLEKQEAVYRDITLLRSQKQTIYTIQQRKLALSSLDDKRYIIPGKFETLPWGHYKIPKDNDDEDDDNW